MSHSENAAKRPSILSVIAPYWKSEEKWFAWSMVAVALCIIFGHIYVSVWANKLAGQLTDTLVNRNWAALLNVIVLTITAQLISGIVPHINVAIQQTVQLRWRQWMTRKYLERWARCSAFYGIERDHLLDNADQRIAENIPQLTQQVLDYTLQAISVFTNIITYSILLWNLAGALSLAPWGLAITIPGYMVVAAFLYTFGAFAVTHWSGKPLLKLNNKMQTTEADFRYLAMQLRENAEQIAFFQGGAREGEMLQVHFKAIFNNTRAVITRTLKVMVTQTTYADVFFLLPTLLALPRYVLGAISMGDVIRLADGFRSLRGSLSWFYQAYTGFAMLVTNINRVRDLVWAMDKVEAQHRGIAVNESHTDAHITGNGIHIHTPQGRNILHVGEFCFRSGERWLVRGRSGAGKSTFLRALAGLWPYGEGKIDMPGDASCMFLPQRSYLPEGSLKAALCYPQAEESFSDEVCQAALHACCLGERATSLHSAERWQHVLSGGEQQRLAIARVLLHKPDFVFLDEATSALDSETEHIVYRAIITALPDSCIVSIAHRAELAVLHSHTLDLARNTEPSPLAHTAMPA